MVRTAGIQPQPSTPAGQHGAGPGTRPEHKPKRHSSCVTSPRAGRASLVQTLAPRGREMRHEMTEGWTTAAIPRAARTCPSQRWRRTSGVSRSVAAVLAYLRSDPTDRSRD